MTMTRYDELHLALNEVTEQDRLCKCYEANEKWIGEDESTNNVFDNWKILDEKRQEAIKKLLEIMRSPVN